MVSPYPQGMAPIQQLPSELKDLICEFVGFEAHRTRDYHVSRPDATLSQDDAYTWTPHSLMPDKVRTNTQVYDDLRSLALVSRDFAAPAQRALFAIVALPRPISYFRLLRTLLLLNPERGRLIRCLIPVGPRIFDNQLFYDNQLFKEIFERAVWKEFIQMFTPTFCEEIKMHMFPNAYMFPNSVQSRPVVSWNPHPTTLNHETILEMIEVEYQIRSRRFSLELMAKALEAVIPLCPQLRAFHLLCSQAPSPTDAFFYHSPLASRTLSLPIGRTLFKSNPRLTTLTVDFRVMTIKDDASPLGLHSSPPLPFTHQSEHSLPSSITHLSLIGDPCSEIWPASSTSLYVLSQWLGENHGLKSLRVLNTLGDANHSNNSTGCNWNTILLKYKSSLEELEFDGRGLLFGMYFLASNLLGHVREFALLRFGEAEVLSCLGQMERLKVIKVPLHYLRRVRVEEWQNPMLLFTVPGVEIVEMIADEDGREVMEPVVRREQDIQVDVQFPVGAERLEVVVPGKVNFLRRWKFITGVRTVVLRGEEAGNGIEEGAVQGAGAFH